MIYCKNNLKNWSFLIIIAITATTGAQSSDKQRSIPSKDSILRYASNRTGEKEGIMKARGNIRMHWPVGGQEAEEEEEESPARDIETGERCLLWGRRKGRLAGDEAEGERGTQRRWRRIMVGIGAVETPTAIWLHQRVGSHQHIWIRHVFSLHHSAFTYLPLQCSQSNIFPFISL